MSADPSLPRPDGFQPPTEVGVPQPTWATPPAPPQAPYAGLPNGGTPYAQAPYPVAPYQPGPPQQQPYQPLVQASYPPSSYQGALPPWAVQPGVAGYAPVYPGAAADPMRRPTALTAVCVIQLVMFGLVVVTGLVSFAAADVRTYEWDTVLVMLLVAILNIVLGILVMMGTRGARIALAALNGIILLAELFAIIQSSMSLLYVPHMVALIATIVVLFNRESNAFFAAHASLRQ